MLKHLLVLMLPLLLCSTTASGQGVAPPVLEPPSTEELVTGPTPQDGFIRAFDTYHNCKRYFGRTFNTRENTARKSTCLGYFYGVGSILLHLQKLQVRTGICLPDDFSVENAMSTFVTWAEVNPDNLVNISATNAVITALAHKYPCY